MERAICQLQINLLGVATLQLQQHCYEFRTYTAQNAGKVHYRNDEQVAFDLLFVTKQHNQRNTAVGDKPCKQGRQADDVRAVYAGGVHASDNDATCAVWHQADCRREETLENAKLGGEIHDGLLEVMQQHTKHAVYDKYVNENLCRVQQRMIDKLPKLVPLGLAVGVGMIVIVAVLVVVMIVRLAQLVVTATFFLVFLVGVGKLATIKQVD